MKRKRRRIARVERGHATWAQKRSERSERARGSFVRGTVSGTALQPQLFSWRCTVKCTITAVSLKPRPATFVTAPL